MMYFKKLMTHGKSLCPAVETLDRKTGATEKTFFRRRMSSRVGFRLFLIVAAVLLNTVSLSAASPGRAVKVGFFHFEGYHEQNESGNLSGYGYEYIRRMCAWMNWDVSYQGYEKSWSEMQTMLENGEIDLLSSATWNKERGEKFDFSAQPIGSSNAILTIKAGNGKFASGDYANWSGIRVGMLRDNSRNSDWKEFAERRGISYVTVWFESTLDAEKALEEGSIDALLTGSLRRLGNEWILEQFAPKPFYIIVRKGNKSLLDEVNRAIAEIKNNSPFLEMELMQRNYFWLADGMLAFSGKERAFIENAKKNGTVLTALVNPDRYPISYWEDGEIRGVFRDIVDLFAQKTGLSIRVLPLRTRAEYYDAVKAGKADLVFDVRTDEQFAERQGISITGAYLSFSLSELRRRDFTGQPKRIALLQESDAEAIIKKHRGTTVEFLPCGSISELASAVRSGRADAGCVYQRTANHLLAKVENVELCSHILYGLTTDFSVGVFRHGDPALFGIMQKTASSLPPRLLSELANHEKEQTSQGFFTPLDWIKANPLTGMGAIAMLFLLLSGLLGGVLLLRRKDYRNAQVLKKLPIRFFVSDRNGRILLLNAPDISDCGNFHHIPDLGTPKVVACMKQAISEAFRSGSSRVDYDYDGIKRSAITSRLPDALFGTETVIWISQDTSELHQARIQAQDLAIRMHLKLQSIGDAVMATDAEGHITLMNPAAEKFCGVTEAEARGKKHEECFNIVNYETGKVVPSPVRQVLATGKMVELANHTDLISLDGTRRHIADSAAPIPGPDGGVSGAILVFRDVTDEYEKRDRLREMIESFKISAEMARVIVFHFDPVTLTVSGITPVEKFIPVKNGRIVPFGEWVLHDDVDTLNQYIENVRSGIVEEKSHVIRSGQTGPTRIFRFFLRKNVASPGELICVMQEITEYVEQETLLRRTREMWEIICNTLPICFFAKDIKDDFRYVMVNEKSAEVVGTSRENMLGKTDRELFRRPVDHEWLENSDQEIVSGKATRQYSEHAFDANGCELYLQTLKTTCTGPDGSELLIGVSMDITESVKKEKELQKTREMWKLIGDALPVFLFTLNVDDEFRYVMCNQSFADFVRIPQNELIGKTCRDVFPHEEIWRKFEQTDLEIVNSGIARTVDETAADEHGNAVYLQTILSPVPGPNGEHFLVGVSVNVTAKKERENRLRISNEKLQKYSKQDQFQKQCLSELLIATDFIPACGKIAEMLGKCLKSLYVNISQYHTDGRPALRSKLTWNETGKIVNLPFQTIYEEEYPATFQKLKEGAAFCITRKCLKNAHIQKLEPWQHEFITYFEHTDTNELLCAPIMRHNRFWGYIGSEYSQEGLEFGEDENRLLVSAAGMVELLSEKHEIRDGLIRSEQEKRLLLDVLPLPVAVLAGDSSILLHNQAFAALVEGSKPDLTGERCLQRICGGDNCSESTCPLRQTLFNQAPQQMEKNIRNHNYMIKTMPVKGTAEIERVIVIFIDMTEMTQRQELLQKAVAKAQEAERSKSYFLATMSHEIRTPLNAVIGFTELLRDGTLPEDRRKDYLNDISIAGNALLSLINDILDLSKLESGQMTFSRGQTDFPRLVNELHRIFQARLNEKQLSFVNKVPTMPLLMTDKQRLRQILFNLIGNAVKFTDASSITLEADFQSESDAVGTLRFSVEDTGCGISIEDRKHIFQPFVQASALRGTQAANNGTGLGLPIVRRMLERMDGSITLTGEPGKGSRFTVEIHHIPLCGSHADSSTSDHAATSGLQYQKGTLSPRILLVDDVPMNLKVVKAMCAKLGVTDLDMAVSGMEALALIEKKHFDLVLTDMWMPGMNGVELVRRIKEKRENAHLRIIALTADIEAQTTFDLRDFSGVLLKPVTLEKISKVVEFARDTDKKIF